MNDPTAGALLQPSDAQPCPRQQSAARPRQVCNTLRRCMRSPQLGAHSHRPARLCTRWPSVLVLSTLTYATRRLQIAGASVTSRCQGNGLGGVPRPLTAAPPAALLAAALLAASIRWSCSGAAAAGPAPSWGTAAAARLRAASRAAPGHPDPRSASARPAQHGHL